MALGGDKCVCKDAVVSWGLLGSENLLGSHNEPIEAIARAQRY